MWIDREVYTAHIHDDEKLIKMRRLLDKIQVVLDNHVLKTTDFLDPYERRLALSILNRFDELEYIEYGGFDNAERKVIIIFPQYFLKDDILKEISILRVDGALENLSHRDYLGALLNLGIIREKIGDILVHENFGFIIVKKEISDYIQYNFEKIGNRNITIKNISGKDLIMPSIEFREVKTFLTSLRLDVVISGAYNLSRKESMNIIKVDKVKVNWEPIDKPALELDQSDIVSIRGYGRFQLYEINGTSKKGRIMCTIRILM